jgi:hypothetical protein
MDCLLNWAQSTELVRTVKHKYNLAQRLLEKSKLTQHTFEEVQKVCWKKVTVLKIKPNTTFRKCQESTHMSLVDHLISQLSLDISPIWTHIIAAESENYSSVQCRLCEKIVFMCWYHKEKLSI